MRESEPSGSFSNLVPPSNETHASALPGSGGQDAEPFRAGIGWSGPDALSTREARCGETGPGPGGIGGVFQSEGDSGKGGPIDPYRFAGKCMDVGADGPVGRPGIGAEEGFSRVSPAVLVRIIGRSGIQGAEIHPFPVIVETVGIRIGNGNAVQDEIGFEEGTGDAGGLVRDIEGPGSGGGFEQMPFR